MTARSEQLRIKYFGATNHPYRIFDALVASSLPPGGALLDAGCGRTAPLLSAYKGRASRLVGIELVNFTTSDPALELYQSSLESMPTEGNSIDVVMARSVMEHVQNPARVYQEVARVLRPGGHFIFLTANFWDYASLIAMAVPNKWHAKIVAKTEGRAEKDVFPTCYKTNTKRAIERFSSEAGLSVSRLDYLGQHPAYFSFNVALYLAATAYEKFLEKIQALDFLRGWILADLVKPQS